MPAAQSVLLQAFDYLEPIGVDAGIISAYLIACNGGEPRDPASLVRFEFEPDLTDEQASYRIAQKWGVA